MKIYFIQDQANAKLQHASHKLGYVETQLAGIRKSDKKNFGTYNQKLVINSVEVDEKQYFRYRNIVCSMAAFELKTQNVDYYSLNKRSIACSFISKLDENQAADFVVFETSNAKTEFGAYKDKVIALCFEKLRKIYQNVNVKMTNVISDDILTYFKNNLSVKEAVDKCCNDTMWWDNVDLLLREEIEIIKFKLEDKVNVDDI